MHFYIRLYRVKRMHSSPHDLSLHIPPSEYTQPGIATGVSSGLSFPCMCYDSPVRLDLALPRSPHDALTIGECDTDNLE